MSYNINTLLSYGEAINKESKHNHINKARLITPEEKFVYHD